MKSLWLISLDHFVQSRAQGIFCLTFQTGMLTHIVVWKYRDDVETEVRQQHLDLLRKLPSVISEIESFAVGFDVIGLPRSYDTGLVATFQNRAELDAYTVHPDHIRVAALGKSISEHVASVDFES